MFCSTALTLYADQTPQNQKENRKREFDHAPKT